MLMLTFSVLDWTHHFFGKLTSKIQYVKFDGNVQFFGFRLFFAFDILMLPD